MQLSLEKLRHRRCLFRGLRGPARRETGRRVLQRMHSFTRLHGGDADGALPRDLRARRSCFTISARGVGTIRGESPSERGEPFPVRPWEPFSERGTRRVRDRRSRTAGHGNGRILSARTERVGRALRRRSPCQNRPTSKVAGSTRAEAGAGSPRVSRNPRPEIVEAAIPRVLYCSARANVAWSSVETARVRTELCSPGLELR